MALAVANSTELADFAVPSLTSVVAPTRDIAQAAVEALLQQGAAGVQEVNVASYALERRESCGCAEPRTAVLE